MTREEAIEQLECIYTEVSTEADRKAVDMAIEALKEQIPQWIPCSERLPDERDFYLVTFKTGGNGRGVVMRFYRTKEDLWTDDGVRRGFYLLPDEVTAWMPLPEPYKEEGEAE